MRTLAALLCLAGLALAAPIPEPAPLEGWSNRGEPTLRKPAGAVHDLSHLLRCCLRCHGSGKPNKRLFDERNQLLPGIPRAVLRDNARIALAFERYAPGSTAESRDLRLALQLLNRP